MSRADRPPQRQRRGRDIAGEHRLEPGVAAADERQGGARRAIAANRLKNESSGPNMIEGRRMVAPARRRARASRPTPMLRA